MKINKYLSFDISLHETLYYVNKYYSNTFLPYATLLDILKDNWLSTGYQSNYEESIFKSFATTALKIYSLNPLDKGCDIVWLNKFITDAEGSKLNCAKIDKLHFLSNDKLELIDYKSGKHLPPKSNSLLTYKTLFTINSIKKKLGVYPDIFSLYYLRHGIKLSYPVNLDIILDTIAPINNILNINTIENSPNFKVT